MEIKISKKPVKYEKAIEYLDRRVHQVSQNKKEELIWFLEHKSVYTCGVNFNQKDVLDKNIKIVKTNRGGKITLHSPGQKVVYFVLNLNRRKKDVRKLINQVENCIMQILQVYQIKSYSDKKNIGIWVKKRKIAAIGIRVSRWIAYHGFSINIKNNLGDFEKIVPCGLNNKKITSLKKEKKIPKKIRENLKKVFLRNLYKI